MNKKEISIENNISELNKLQLEINKISKEWNLSPKILFNLNLAIEEIVTNIIFYGFDDDFKHIINIKLFLEHDKLKTQIIDEGKEFNPLEEETPDHIDKPLEERDIGGLGIHFVKNIMDKIEFKREKNKNILTLIKKIN
jgi:anti-sigma regulatory factor (Ser/Thr protein kinase)